MDIPPPDALVHLVWEEDLHLSTVHGQCPVLQRLGHLRPGESLAHVLDIETSEAARLDGLATAKGGGIEFLRVGSAESGGWVRLSFAGGRRAAWVMDLQAVLHEAPPLQISALSSALSHELRNPLSSVKLSVQTLARNKELSARDQRRLTIAQREIRTLERMLTMLAEYGRPRPLTLDTVGLRELLAQAVDAIGFELTGRQQTVRVDAPAPLPSVRADAHRTWPVLAQLLLNVAAALPEGASVEVQLRPTASGGALLCVRDEATTLSSEEQAQAFQPFGSRLARGAGLSLAALRQVMLHQGGAAQVHTDEKPGTLFTLAFAPG
jgi:two-component system, NtrC family, sensor histidine kinase HydH